MTEEQQKHRIRSVIPQSDGSDHSDEPVANKSQSNGRERTAVTRKRSVRFGDGDQLVTAVFEPNTPWANAEPLNPYELAGAYKLRCDVEGLEPLYSVLAQLEAINLKDSYARRDVFTLKGTQLRGSHIEVLEEVFKRVQFDLLNLENTNLTDESCMALCEMIEFYESCTELCLARNPQITSQGWKSVTRLVRKLPCLKWLDLRGGVLCDADSQSLTHAIRSQAMACRAEMSKFFKFQQANQRLVDLDQSVADSGEDAQTTLTAELKRLATCQSHGTVHCPQCLAQIPYQGLHGLHLGATKIRDVPLSRLVSSIRLSSISDLRLTDNRLTASDAVFLIPLLRFGAALRHLDLSRNRLGDEGCKVIANALSSTAFPTQPPASAAAGLRRLYLADNQLTEDSMGALARALQHCTYLTCLQLGGNPRIGCTGVVTLQPGILHSRQLKRLGLSRCGVACIGAVALAEVMVDRPRRLSRLDLRENDIGSAGLMALGRCLKCVDRRVRIDGLISPDSSTPISSPSASSRPVGLLTTVARLAAPPPRATDHVPSAIPEQPPDPIHAQAVQMFIQMLADNHSTYPIEDKPTRVSTRYSRIQIPSLWSMSASSPTGTSSFTNSVEELDPRYLWGDSSDESELDGLGESGSDHAVIASSSSFTVSATTTNGHADVSRENGENRIVRLNELGQYHPSTNGVATDGIDSDANGFTLHDHGPNEHDARCSPTSALVAPFPSSVADDGAELTDTWRSRQWDKSPKPGCENLVSVPLI